MRIWTISTTTRAARMSMRCVDELFVVSVKPLLTWHIWRQDALFQLEESSHIDDAAHRSAHASYVYLLHV